jgi:hypothetical protein
MVGVTSALSLEQKSAKLRPAGLPVVSGDGGSFVSSAQDGSNTNGDSPARGEINGNVVGQRTDKRPAKRATAA